MPTTRRVDLPRKPQRRGHPALARIAGAALVGVVVGVGLVVVGAPGYALLAGWCVTCVLFLTVTWALVWPMDAGRTADHAVQEDPTRAAADLLLLVAALASLAAVGLILVKAGSDRGGRKDLDVAVAVVSVVLSWSMVHTVYTLRYARLYFAGGDGGISFNQDGPPCYSDFAYFSFTLGMTFQVSDTDISDTTIRRTAFHQALLSYLLGVVIIASVINLIGGLSK